jgi:hypothetical protein
MPGVTRSPLLKALCILSFTGNGFGFLLYLTAAIMNQNAREWIGELSSLHDTSRLTPVYFSLFSLFYVVSFIGVWKMWNVKKTGFLYYSFSQLAILVLPLIWIGSQAFSSVVLIFTVLFVTLFGIQMKKL